MESTLLFFGACLAVAVLLGLGYWLHWRAGIRRSRARMWRQIAVIQRGKADQ